MAYVDLYVDKITVTTGWTRVGTTPYLNTQNQPTSYIWSAARNANSDTFGFASSADLGTITNVTLYIYAQGVASTNFDTYLDGVAVGLGPPASWSWVNHDVTSALPTWADVNAAVIYFDRPSTTQQSNVDAAYLRVTYSPSASSSRHAYIDGKDTLNTSQSAYIEGTAPQLVSSNKSAYIQGSVPATLVSDSQPAFIRGKNIINSSKVAYIDGSLAIKTNKSAYLKGSYTAISSKSGFIKGRDSRLSSKSAYISGKLTKITSKSAYLKGKINTLSSKSAFITGKITNSIISNKPAYIKGRILSGPSVDQQQLDNSMDMTNFGYNNQRKFAQTFKPFVTADIYSITVYLNSFGSPIDKVRLEIYTDGGIEPGSLLGTAIEDFTVPISPDFYTFRFQSGIQLTADSTYWLVLSRTGAIDESKFYTVWGNDEGYYYDPYPRGTSYIQFSDNTWIEYSYPPTAYADIYFIEYYATRGFSKSAYIAGLQTGGSSVSSHSAFIIGIDNNLVPDGDVTKVGVWKNEIGATTNLYQSIDEIVANDNDYVWNIDPQNGDYIEFSLSNPISTPGDGDVVIFVRVKVKTGVPDSIYADLYQGTTQKAELWMWPTSIAYTYHYTLTPAQKSSITDWTDLRIRIYIDMS